MVLGKELEIKGTIRSFEKGENAYGVYYKCKVQIYNEEFDIFIDEREFNNLELGENKQIIVYQVEKNGGNFWKFDKWGNIKWYENKKRLKEETSKEKNNQNKGQNKDEIEEISFDDEIV